MKKVYLLIAVGLGAVAWIIESMVDSMFFYEKSFLDLLIFDIPSHELYVRLMIIILFILFGIIIASIHHQRDKATEQLKETFTHLNTIFETVPGGLCIVDPSYRILKANRAYRELFEIESESDTTNCQELSCSPFCATDRCPVHRIMNGEQQVTEEFDLVRRDGVTITYLMTARPARNANGDISCIVCSYRDLTELRTTIEQQTKSEATLRTILQASPIGIGMVKDRIIGWTNDRFAELTGYTHEELQGMPARQVYLSDEEYERIGREKHAEVLKSGTGTIQTRFRRKDGTIIDAILSSSSIVPGDLSSGMVFTVVDITDQKQLETQLIQAQKMETIGRLAGGIAHDFNNLLTVIFGISELAIHTLSEADPLYQDMVTIKETAERASILTRQLLTFSRRQIIEPRPINLNDGLRSMDRMLRRLISENIRLETRLMSNLWTVNIDPGQVEQVLTNLVINARDAMPNGGILTIETANTPLNEDYTRSHSYVTPGDYVMLAVSDTGIGMTDEVSEKIFEPFFTTKTRDKGTGLGLSTCYGIVKQNNGYIWAYSEPGVGTTMKVYLPCTSEGVTKFTLNKETDATPEGSETILIAEDDHSVRSMVTRILNEHGYTVFEAVDGEDALKTALKLESGHLDLVITDIVMPLRSGRELASALRMQETPPKLLFISGYTEYSVIDQGLLNHDAAFLQKPFTPVALLQKVRSLIDT